jgi:hypothetical protein
MVCSISRIAPKTENPTGENTPDLPHCSKQGMNHLWKTC